MNEIGEGTWFAVPVQTGGYALGVVARTTAGGGVVLAYFFGNVYTKVPLIEDIESLGPESAVRIFRVGDLGLIDGTWPIIGYDPRWRREDWKMPKFIRKDDLSRRAWIVQYSEADANIVESEGPIDYDAKLERDAVLGAGAVETLLTRML